MSIFKPNGAPAYTWLALASMGLAACASTPMERAKSTRTTMDDMEGDIQEASRQLDATEASLAALMRPGQGEIKETFDSYSSNVERMASMEQTLSGHADQMKRRGEDYFDEWEKDGEDYKNPAIKQLSKNRREDFKQIYDRIAANSIGLDAAFKEYVSDLQEIRSFLANDLSAKGVSAIAPTSADVLRRGNNIQDALRGVQSAIREARAEMAHAGRS